MVLELGRQASGRERVHLMGLPDECFREAAKTLEVFEVRTFKSSTSNGLFYLLFLWMLPIFRASFVKYSAGMGWRTKHSRKSLMLCWGLKVCSCRFRLSPSHLWVNRVCFSHDWRSSQLDRNRTIPVMIIQPLCNCSGNVNPYWKAGGSTHLGEPPNNWTVDWWRTSRLNIANCGHVAPLEQRAMTFTSSDHEYR